MTSCAQIPTETQFAVITSTSTSLSTVVSTSITSLPSSTVSSVSTLCLDITSSGTAPATGTCATPSVTTIVNTVGGETSTHLVTTTTTVPVTVTSSTPTRTLFSTSCTTSSTTTKESTTTSSPSTSSTPTPTPPPSNTSESSVPVTFTSESSTTLSNGSVVVTSVLITTSLPPEQVTITTPAPSLNTGESSAAAKKVPIIGGVVGGVVALLAVIAGIWFIWRRSKRWRDIFDEEEDEKANRPRMALDNEDVQPRPYQYGLVGHSGSPSPPSSPPVTPRELGYARSTSALNVPTSHSRSSSGGAISMSDPLLSRQSYEMSSTSGTPTRHAYRTQNISITSNSSARPLLERPVNRPPSSWSIGGQNIGAELATSPVRPSPSTTPRPHSAGGALQSSASEHPIPPVPQIASPPGEKRRAVQQTSRPSTSGSATPSLPPGAAVPTPPSSSSMVPQQPTSPPPITPRSPRRPKSSKGVVVHSDGGPATEEMANRGPDNAETDLPPAYSPT